MDHIDRKIIDILQRDARAPLKQIADQVFLSSLPYPPASPSWRKTAA